MGARAEGQSGILGLRAWMSGETRDVSLFGVPFSVIFSKAKKTKGFSGIFGPGLFTESRLVLFLGFWGLCCVPTEV